MLRDCQPRIRGVSRCLSADLSKTYIYGQGEQPKFATALRDDLIFPETDQNFETLLVHFSAGYGRDAAHADPLGVPKIVAQVARDFVAFRLRSLQEEIAE